MHFLVRQNPRPLLVDLLTNFVENFFFKFMMMQKFGFLTSIGTIQRGELTSTISNPIQ
jgi:hypothetical protein